MQEFEYRGFRLWRRTDDGRGVFCAIYRDADRQRRRVSLDTTDEAAARDRLVKLALERADFRAADPAEVTVGEIVTRYYERHAKHLPSGEQADHHARHLRAHLGAIALSDLIPAVESPDGRPALGPFSCTESIDPSGVTKVGIRPEHVREFTRAMRPRSNGYINRVLSDLRSAIRMACREREVLLAEPPFIPVLPPSPPSPPRQRVLSIEEMIAVWSAAEVEPFHVRLFLVLALGTASRPGALLEVRKEQIDFGLKLIDLNGGGEQTNKLRPVVPMVPSVEKWLAVAPGPFVVQLAGRPLADIKSSWRRLRKRAGLGGDVIPYTLRHSVATHLRVRGVPMEEIAVFLGHTTGFRTTERYAKPLPQAGLGYLPRVREAVEGLLSDIGRGGARPVSAFNLSMAKG